MSDQALQDLKVLDFGWVAAVPILTLQLALHGAQVIRVESSARPDASRATGPFIDDDRRVSAAFGQLNSNKRSLGVNLKDPEGRQAVLDLVEWADVVTENFRPGTLAKLGLGFEDLAERNPRIVMLQSSSAGQTGHLSRMAATGDLLQSLCGFTHLTGFPDEHPMPPWGAWTDITVPPIGIASVLAAVRQSRRTGQGQLLDMSQMELSVAFLADQLVAAQTTGNEPQRNGNRDSRYSPHGVYPASDGGWLAVTVTADEQWAGLARLIGLQEWAGSWATAALRRDQEDRIDAALAAWTTGRSVEDSERLLREAGVPCAAVQDSRQVLEDPQLAHRGYFQYVQHETAGPVMAPASAYVLSETPAKAAQVAPEIGQDSWQICTELLGYDDERAALLMASGAIE